MRFLHYDGWVCPLQAMASAWEQWTSKMLGTAFACVCSAVWTYRVSQRTAPGARRFLACLPVLVIYWILPFIFDMRTELLSLASVAAMFLWLSTFKVLGLCMNRGPLAVPGLTRSQFAALQLWPVVPKQGAEGQLLRVEARGLQRLRLALQRLLWRARENLVIFVVSLFLLSWEHTPGFVCTYACAFGVCAYCDAWANAAAALVMLIHGIQVSPSWDRPWLQTSLADFWGRRWNLPAGASLKMLIYDPIMEGSLIHRMGKPAEAKAKSNGPATAAVAGPAAAAAAAAAEPAGQDGHDSNGTMEHNYERMGSGRDVVRGSTAISENKASSKLPVGMQQQQQQQQQLATTAKSCSSTPVQAKGKCVPASRRALATCATFFVSGVMHEVLLLYTSQDRSQQYKQLCYFMLMVPLSILEQQLKKAAAKSGFQLPRWLSIPLASLTLQVPGYWLFWRPYFTAIKPPSKPFLGVA